MKAITLWQPWASAVALGSKTIETRGWSTPYRGPLAIHAAKRFGGEQMQKLRVSDIECGSLPLGAIVAVANLVNVIPTSGLVAPPLLISDAERWWGDYSPGRFAWILQDVRALPTPVPFKGKQGFFHVPDQLLEQEQ